QLVYSLVKFDTDSQTGKIKYEIFDANRQSITRTLNSQWLENLNDPTKNTISEHKQGEVISRGTDKAIKLNEYWEKTNKDINAPLDFNKTNEVLKRLGIEYD